MGEINLAEARVLVLDEKAHDRRQATALLNSVGFVDIVESAETESIPQFLAEREIQLIVASVRSIDDDILNVVEKIRNRRAGSDPFVPIMLNAWMPDRDLVRAVLNSGVDDLVVWPISIDQLRQRVDALITARKNFVATEKYFGPDRRTGAEARESGLGFKVPNGLRATAMDDPSAAPDPDAINLAFSAMLVEKVHHEAKALHTQSTRLAMAAATKNRRALHTGVAEMMRAHKNLKTTIASLELEQMNELSVAVGSVLENIGKGPSSVDNQQYVLLEKTTLALSMAAAAGKEANGELAGISQEIRQAGRRSSDLMELEAG